MPSEALRAWLEIAYYVSAALLVPISLVAVWQLKIAKRSLAATEAQVKLAAESLLTAQKDMHVRSKREAVSLAAEQCVKFAENILPRYLANAKAIRDADVKIVRWPVSNVEFDDSSLPDDIKEKAAQWEQSIVAKRTAGTAMMAILNDMEAFAIYFARGAADEEVAYPVVGAIFCEWAEAFAPYIVQIRVEKVYGVTSGPFQNIVDLYGVWAVRTKRKQLELAANRINLELAGTNVPTIRPLGTDGA
jgi:hypothetical protein